MIDCDIAILICSRGREEVLTRLLDDLRRGFAPALEAGGLTSSIFVYAQGYSRDYLDGLERRFADAIRAEKLVIVPSTRPHGRIGDVVHTAVRAVHDRARYRLAMLMDDDSIFDPHPAVDDNLRRAARSFIEQGHRAYSIKLGPGTDLSYGRFVEPVDPIMPFKEKMLWVSRAVLEEVLGTPRFDELSIGEDAVIAAVAWLADPASCFAVYGMGTFLHLGFEETREFAGQEIAGGYADLMNYHGPRPELVHGKYDEALRTGVTPHHVMPDVFVPEDHPLFIFNGIRERVVRARAADRDP